MVSVIVLLAGRSWTSVQCNELDDHLLNDSSLIGPSYLALDSVPLTPEDFQLFTYLNARQISEKIWQSKDTPATLIAKLYRYRFRLIGTAGSGSGFSGKARYSADVAVTNYRWTWTMVKEQEAEFRELPPPYPAI